MDGVTAGEFAVPAVLRGYRLVPRQAPDRREPARVTPGAFRARGLPVPEHAAHLNIYRLSGGEGVPWSATIDAHVGRRGAELLPGGDLVLVDVDVPAAVDGTPLVDSFRWLSDRAVEAGEFLDLSATLSVRTPGHEAARHLPGWHLWFRADRDRPVRMGPLRGCKHVELKTRGTCPGSPGYVVRSCPDELPLLPGWMAAQAGRPEQRERVMARDGARPWNRLHGILARLLAAEPGERNALLFWSAARCGEMVGAGDLDTATAERVLAEAAADLGLATDDGASAVLATIRSGLAQSRGAA